MFSACRSKNKLTLKMNESDQSALADVTVFDVMKRFRLVVMEVHSRNRRCDIDVSVIIRTLLRCTLWVLFSWCWFGPA
jgi:hypothetical protein